MRRKIASLVAPVAAVLAVSGAAHPAGSVQRWALTDLGDRYETLAAVAINDRGQIAGVRDTGDGRPAHLMLWSGGEIVDLGTLGGSMRPRQINAHGAIVGSGGTGWTDPARPYRMHAFVWIDGDLLDLTPDTLEGNAYAINDRGQVVGDRYTGAKDERGVFVRHAFRWQSGKMTDLGTLPGGKRSTAYAINERGQVVGWSETKHGVHAFLWQDGKMRDLGALGGGRYSRAMAINERGQIVGFSAKEYPWWRAPHATLWSKGRMTDLGEGTASGVNARGQVIGEGFFWERGRRIDLDLFAAAISDRGQVVGSTDVTPSDDAVDDSTPALWQHGRTTRLPTLSRSRGFGAAVAINGRDQIVGSSATGSDRTHAVLWTLRRG